ncbi:MAG: glycosyltransferase [Novosphingobium sp.]|uniref:glycosyltransferase n=1 Tax=Novosphingobium sp. TaxID=1874826 RepID=UPI00301A6E9F
MSSAVNISVVIRTLNEAEWLPSLLDAIERQDLRGMTAETVVVDSGSTDGTYEIAAERGCQMVTIEKSQFTFGRSLNYGCEASAGKWLVIISGHCVAVGTNWLHDLVAPLAAGTCSYTYGRQIGLATVTKFSESQLFLKYFPEKSAIPQDGFFCNNANAALTKQVWQENPFDEELTGLEDMELGKRLLQKGHKIGYVAEAVVEHIHNETWKKVERRYEREALALRTIMPELTLGVRDCMRYIAAGVWHDIVAATRQGRLHRELVGIVLFRTMQYVGTYKGNHLHRELSRASKEKYFYPR